MNDNHPPAPDDFTDQRWQESRRRRRMLEGKWREDLRRMLHRQLGDTRAHATGNPDITKNLLRAVVSQMAITYDSPPLIKHENETQRQLMTGLLDIAGLWSLSARHQQMLLAQREAGYCIDVVDGEFRFHPIPADRLLAISSPETPMEPHTIYWYRPRQNLVGGKPGEVIWTRDCYSIENPDMPVFRIEDAEGTQDLTSVYGGLGEVPRKADGMPVLPIVLNHASNTGKLWDPFFGIELVEGALQCAVFWTFFGHVLRDASWPQRWAVNAVPAGSVAQEDRGGSYVVTDPSSVLMLLANNPDLPVSLGQWQPGGDPSALGAAIRSYAADLAVDFGLSPSDLERQVGDARSGYAIFLTREGVRATQRRLEPQMRRNDLFLMQTAAAVWNTAGNTPTLAEDGWDIEYRGLPLSIEEKRAKMEAFEKRAALGITSRVNLLAELDGITEDQARERLREIQRDNLDPTLNP